MRLRKEKKKKGEGRRKKQKAAAVERLSGKLSLLSSLSLFSTLSFLTILPDAKISAVVFGSRIRMMTAAKRCCCE